MMAEGDNPPERHVAVFAFPISSHPSVVLSMVRRLATAAPTVKFSFFNSAKSNSSLFSASTPSNIRPYDVSDGLPEGFAYPCKPQEDIGFFSAVADQEFRRAVQVAEAHNGKIGCVVADAFLWFTGLLAEEMHVPWVPLWPAGAAALSTHYYTDFIRQNAGANVITGDEDEIVKFVPGFPEIRLGDLQGGIILGNLEWPLSIMLHKMGQTLPKATAVVINSFEELDPEFTKHLKSQFKNCLSIIPTQLTAPPPLNSDEFSCIPWLDKHKPRSVAYIGFGTVVQLLPDELVALAEALEEKNIPFLWSLNDRQKKHLPEAFVERTSSDGLGKIVPWAPQVQVLGHTSVGVFVNHGGWNSVLESIGAGVPLISRPFFGDHHLNTWMIEKVWEVGVRVEAHVFTKSGAARALEQVLLSEKGNKFKENVIALKELARKAVEPDGSSTKNFKTLLDIIASYNL